jgi:hypothetical protein
MAANTYTQDTVTGPVRMQRAVRQGRKSMPRELVRVKADFMTLPATKARIEAEAKRRGMTFSAYCDLAVSLFDIEQFSSQENC